jgi:ABC-type multidrug transport system ATPase subunit
LIANRSRSLLVAEGVSRSFGPIMALRDTSLSLGYGEIVGVVGPNGAGKSTLALILSGFLLPTTGSVTFFETDSGPRAFRERFGIGFLHESSRPFPDRTVDLILQTAVEPGRAFQILDTLLSGDLEEVRNRSVGTLSRGQAQMVGVAYALACSGPFIILDEPDAGLDPSSLELVEDVIRARVEDGRSTVLVLSHRLHELGDLCHRTLFVRDGTVVAECDRAGVEGTGLKALYNLYCGSRNESD